MLILPSELTHRHASACLRQWQQQLDGELRASHAQITVDARALQRFDSSTLAVLLHCRRQALQHGKSLSVQNMPAALHRLAHLYGVAQLLQIQAQPHTQAQPAVDTP